MILHDAAVGGLSERPFLETTHQTLEEIAL